jgi:hypothetical protein
VSPVASATPQPRPAALGAPGNVIAQPGRTRVILLWTAPATIGGAKVSGYLIYMGTRPGGESGTPVTKALVHDTAYAVMGLASTTTYYFKVAAQDAAGHRGARSAEVSAVPWPAATPGSTGHSPAGHGPTGQGTQPTDPVQILPVGGKQSPTPTPQNTNLTQDHSAPGTPAGLIILLAGVAAAALAGAAGIAVHLRRMRIRSGGPGEPEELDNRPRSGPRYR